MVNCKQCEMLMDYPIRVVDVPAKHFLDNEVIHFEDGFKCMYNGVESLNLVDLSKGSCRCRGDGDD